MCVHREPASKRLAPGPRSCRIRDPLPRIAFPRRLGVVPYRVLLIRKRAARARDACSARCGDQDRPKSRHKHCTERSAAAAASGIAVVAGERWRRGLGARLAEECSAGAENERAFGFKAAAPEVVMMRPAS